MKSQGYKSVLYLLLALFGQVHATESLVLTQVSLDDAVKMVINGNRLLDAATENINDQEIHVIKVLTEDGRVQKHKINVQTGKRMDKGKN